MLEMNRRATLLALPSLVLLAGCSSPGSPAAAHPTASAGARQALLASVQKSAGSSFLADMTVAESFTSTGDGRSKGIKSLAGRSLAFSVHMSAENSNRIRLTVQAGSALPQLDAVAVTYDGTLYVSSDGGTTFKVVPAAGAAPDQYAADNALAYLQAVGSVTDEGPGTADGVAVERYSAQLDGTKLLALVRSALSSVHTPIVQELLNSITFRSGTLAVTLDHQGRIVSESGPLDVTADLSAFGAALAGTTLHIHEVIDAHFHDYGSAVTVTKPAVIASS
jgi:hypothetical protein